MKKKTWFFFDVGETLIDETSSPEEISLLSITNTIKNHFKQKTPLKCCFSSILKEFYFQGRTLYFSGDGGSRTRVQIYRHLDIYAHSYAT